MLLQWPHISHIRNRRASFSINRQIPYSQSNLLPSPLKTQIMKQTLSSALIILYQEESVLEAQANNQAVMDVKNVK